MVIQPLNNSRKQVRNTSNDIYTFTVGTRQLGVCQAVDCIGRTGESAGRGLAPPGKGFRRYSLPKILEINNSIPKDITFSQAYTSG